MIGPIMIKMGMQKLNPDLLASFRAPAFPGSYFLSFEGIEGAGKSSQIVKVIEYLEQKGFRVIRMREPGGTKFGEKLRQAILESKSEIHPIAEAHLFASSRAQLLSEVTLKELKIPGTIIIYDRYIDSTFAYQGKAGGLGMETVLRLHQDFPLSTVPHLTLYIKIGLDTSQKRQTVRNAPKDYFESQGKEFYQNLIAGYEEAAETFPDRISVINGEKDFNSVFEQICLELDKLLAKGKSA